MKRMEPRCVVCSWPLRVVSHIVILNLRAPYLSIIFEVKSRFFGGQNWRLSPISIFLDFWYVFYTLYFSRIPQKTFLLQLVWGITIEWLDYYIFNLACLIFLCKQITKLASDTESDPDTLAGLRFSSYSNCVRVLELVTCWRKFWTLYQMRLALPI